MRSLLRWKGVRRIAGILSMTLVLSCGGGKTTFPEGSLQVTNDCSTRMTSLYVTPNDSSTWGPNQLGSVPLEAWNSLTIQSMTPGYYDVQARFYGDIWDTVYGVLVSDGAVTTLSMRNSGKGSVRVTNNSFSTITALYFTHATSTTWGPNLLDSVLYPSDYAVISGVTPGTYDIKVVFDGVSSSTYPNIYVDADSQYPLSVSRSKDPEAQPTKPTPGKAVGKQIFFGEKRPEKGQEKR